MKQAIVTLWGKYKYKIYLKGNESMQEIAMKIALEVHNQEGKTKFTGTPRAYNYIYECLLRKSCLNFRINTEDTKNNEKELLQACNELHNKSEFFKKDCDVCKGKGDLENWECDINDCNESNLNNSNDCYKCKGYGYYYEHQDYRLGYTQSNTLIIDVDGKELDNLKNVKVFYENTLQCEFKVFRTNNGYWLFADKKYKDLQSWVFDHCRVLCPSLELCCFEEYRAKLLALDEGEKGEFQRATPDKIKSSGLYKVPEYINFDVAFTFLSIKRERSTIRITKKHKDDKIELINI